MQVFYIDYKKAYDAYEAKKIKPQTVESIEPFNNFIASINNVMIPILVR